MLQVQVFTHDLPHGDLSRFSGAIVLVVSDGVKYSSVARQPRLGYFGFSALRSDAQTRNAAPPG